MSWLMRILAWGRPHIYFPFSSDVTFLHLRLLVLPSMHIMDSVGPHGLLSASFFLVGRSALLIQLKFFTNVNHIFTERSLPSWHLHIQRIAAPSPKIPWTKTLGGVPSSICLFLRHWPGPPKAPRTSPEIRRYCPCSSRRIIVHFSGCMERDLWTEEECHWRSRKR